MAKSKQTVDEYIAERSPAIQSLLKELQSLVEQALPDASLAMKWGAPVFRNSHGKDVVYLYGGKDHANLGFIHGAELKDPEKLLKGTGISGRHIKIYPTKPAPENDIKALVRQCGHLR